MKPRTLAWFVMAALSFAIVAAPVYKPAKTGAYYSSDGTGHDGTWLPMAGTGSAGPPVGKVSAAGIYYSSDGTGNDGTWLPCGPNCFGVGTTLPNGTVATTQPPGDNSTKVATTAYVATAVAAGAAPWFDWMPGGQAMQVSAAFGLTANAQNATGFTSPTSATYSKISYGINTIDNSASLYSIGWANASGTVICSTGAIAGTTFAPTASFFTLTMTPSCTFTAGSKYYLIWTGNAAVMKFQAYPVGSFLRQGNVGTTSGGVLVNFTPAADSWNVSVNQTPWVDMHN